MRRPVLKPHPGLGDDAERAFRADHQPVRAGTCAGARQAAALHDAGRRHRTQAFHELVDVGVERGVVAAGARRDPAAEGREAEGLREVPEREPRRLELGFERRPEHAALNAGRPGRAVDLEHLVEAAEIDGERARVCVADGGLDTPHHRRPRAKGNDREPRIARPVEQRGDVRLVLGVGDDVRRHGEVARPGADVVRVRLAVGVARAAVGVAVAELGQRTGRGHPGRRQVQLGLGGGRCVGAGHEASEPAHAPGDPARVGLAQRFRFEAPAPELAPRLCHAVQLPEANARAGCAAPR